MNQLSHRSNQSHRSHGPFPLPDGTPRVTVVIPCYNYRHYLGFAVSSALQQPALDIEVIIVDDASADGSAEFAAELASADNRIRLIRHPVNRGHIATYNDGLAQATGEYVVLLSADDVLPAGALTRSVSLLSAHPNVGLVYGRPVRFSTEQPPSPVTEVTAWTVWSGQEWAGALFNAGRNALLSPEAVLRTSVQREIGGYDPDEPHSGDLAMWLRAAAVSDIGHVAGCDQAFYREHNANMHSVVFSADDAKGMVDDLRARLLTFQAAAQLFPNHEELYQGACRALAVEALDLASRAFVWGLTDSWPVTALREFAVQTYSGTHALPQWRVLNRRSRLGPRLSKRNPIFIPRERRVRTALDRELDRWADARI